MPEQKQAPGSVALREVGRRLERLRLRGGFTLVAAASRCQEQGLRSDASALSRIENGRRRTVPRDLVTALLDLYQAGERDRTEVMEFLAPATSPGRRQRPPLWRRHGELLEAMKFGNFLELEAQATLLRNFELAVIPGLLQTAEYARHAITAFRPDLTSEKIDGLCDVRLHRQRALADGPARELHALIDGSALHRTIGSPAVMREQLEHLLAASEAPATTIRILPTAVGGHPGLAGPFVIMTFPEATHARDIVWIETLSTSVYLDQETEVARYTDAFTHLWNQALDPAHTRNHLKEQIQELHK
ncbi:helix-turn-helix domain-containing protein [Streptomyces uncialis]|uniref:helix-turn-helix domain-containing protein n=1 Tax=Streptomyces uncialis TaxID=1048205 RepID=UPI0036688550